MLAVPPSFASLLCDAAPLPTTALPLFTTSAMSISLRGGVNPKGMGLDSEIYEPDLDDEDQVLSSDDDDDDNDDDEPASSVLGAAASSSSSSAAAAAAGSAAGSASSSAVAAASSPSDTHHVAAVRIQQNYRAWEARKRYGEMLFDRMMEEEDLALESDENEDGDGLLDADLPLVDSLHLIQQIAEEEYLRGFRKRQEEGGARTIQRAYRETVERRRLLREKGSGGGGSGGGGGGHSGHGSVLEAAAAGEPGKSGTSDEVAAVMAAARAAAAARVGGMEEDGDEHEEHISESKGRASPTLSTDSAEEDEDTLVHAVVQGIVAVSRARCERLSEASLRACQASLDLKIGQMSERLVASLEGRDSLKQENENLQMTVQQLMLRVSSGGVDIKKSKRTRLRRKSKKSKSRGGSKVAASQ